ncbi:MAG: hypothetical protein M1833_000315 [Piccolia ochrophora]|nr:MAG: hypothetical protein M1833_000315 [Piccolia ochrophora]
MAQTEQHKEGVWDPTRAQTQEMLGKLLDLSSNLNLTTEITPIMAWDIVEKQDIFPHMAAADFEFVMEQIKPHMRCHGFGAVFPAEHLWIALDALKSRILDPTAVQVKPAPPSPTPVPSSPASLVRLQCRSGSLSSPTVDLAPGFAQANLLVLPLEYAKDFRDLCLRNPVPCPLLACSTDVGDPTCTSDASILAGVFDLRTDLPRYNVYSEGELVSTPTDIMKEWTSKHVAFLIGCSFTFENALSRAGLTPRHLERRVNVSMFNTTEKLNPSGIFQNATYVVSMRPYLPEQIEQVRNITRPFISMHGEPIDWGWDACGRLGIADVSNPDFGDPVEFKDGEVPVFWGCGVTPQLAVIAAGNKINGPVMAHAPGHMLVLDWKEEDIVTNPAHHITVMNMVEADRENEFYRPSPMES